MSFINYASREINCKIVYYGPGLCGKTTNLQHVYQKTANESKGKMISLATESERTLFFDFLPLALGEVRGFKTRFHLYTRMDANIESLENLKDNLEEQGYDLDKLPFVIQYNKQDLSNLSPMDELQQFLNPNKVPEYKACAMSGVGVFETLKGIAKLVLMDLKKGSR